jgi:hypothetical protein
VATSFDRRDAISVTAGRLAEGAPWLTVGGARSSIQTAIA